MIDIALHKSYTSKSLDFSLDIKIQVDRPGIIGIKGISGSGKTTLFRMLSGLTVPSSGIISMNQKVWYNSDISINSRPQERSCGYLFQEATLFPNFSLFENIRFANTNLSQSKIEGYLKELNLIDQKELYPSSLSGGQQKRGALLVALARSYDLLLLDEPFVALDAESQLKVKHLIEKVQKERNCTVLIASHHESILEELCSQTFSL